MPNGKTEVFCDPGVLPEGAKVYQCVKCHAVFVMSEAEDCREIASWKVCCGIPFIVPLVVQELEYGDEPVKEMVNAGR
jgi:hypothetical protein